MSKGVYDLAHLIYQLFKTSILFAITSLGGLLFVSSNVYILSNKRSAKEIIKNFIACIIIELYIILLIYFNFQIWYFIGNTIFGIFIKVILFAISLAYAMLLIVVYAKTDNNLRLTFKNSYIIMVLNLGKSALWGIAIAVVTLLIAKISSLLLIIILPGLIIYLQEKYVYSEVKKYYEIKD